MSTLDDHNLILVDIEQRSLSDCYSLLVFLLCLLSGTQFKKRMCASGH